MPQAAKKLNTAVSALSERKRRIYDFLCQNPTGVLSTVTASGGPHGSVVHFSVTEQFITSFVTRSDTQKYDNLTANPQAMFTVFEPVNQTTVQIRGRVEKMTDTREVEKVTAAILAAALATSESGLPPVSRQQAGDYVAFSIIPTQIRMAKYGEPTNGDYSQLFESVESFDLDYVV